MTGNRYNKWAVKESFIQNFLGCLDSGESALLTYVNTVNILDYTGHGYIVELTHPISFDGRDDPLYGFAMPVFPKDALHN